MVLKLDGNVRFRGYSGHVSSIPPMSAFDSVQTCCCDAANGSNEPDPVIQTISIEPILQASSVQRSFETSVRARNRLRGLISRRVCISPNFASTSQNDLIQFSYDSNLSALRGKDRATRQKI